MANSCVLFFTDNAAVVDITNKQTPKHEQVMILIRYLYWLSCLKYGEEGGGGGGGGDISYYFEVATSRPRLK